MFQKQWEQRYYLQVFGQGIEMKRLPSWPGEIKRKKEADNATTGSQA